MPRVLVVLGADGSVGRGAVEAALDAGRAVVAVGLDEAARRVLLERHPQARLAALPDPVSSDADAAALAARLRVPGVAVDGVIASLVGSHPCGHLLDGPAEVLQRALDRDLLPHLFAARHLLPLLAHDSAGYVLVGGPGGRYPWAGYGHCSIAAAALRMMARVLHDEAGREGRRVQLLAMDAPVASDPALPLSLGRRALAMLDAARGTGAPPIVDYAASMAPGVIATPPAPSPGSTPPPPARRAADAAALVPARDLRSARALLDAIAFPTSPGSLHDEHC